MDFHLKNKISKKSHDQPVTMVRAVMANCDSGHDYDNESWPAYDSGHGHEDDEDFHITFLFA